MLRTLAFSLLLAAIFPHDLGGAEGTVEFPLPHYEDALYIPVTIGGDERLFVLDSGAALNAFDEEFREFLGPPIADTGVHTAEKGRIVEAQMVQPPMATVAGRPLSRTAPVLCLDLSTLRQSLGRDVDGILGMPFLQTNIVQVDFDKRTITILPEATPPEARWGQPWGVFESERNRPLTHARFGTFDDEPCLIDTGFMGSYSLGLRSEVFTYLSEQSEISPIASTASISLAGLRKTPTHLGRLAEFEIAHNRHANLVVGDGHATSSIGLTYLRRYLVTFDFGEGKMYLAPGMDFDQPDKPSLGMAILRLSSATIVKGVQSESPAYRAGFHDGDEILSVDGEEISEKPTAEIIWMVRDKPQSDDGAKVLINRDGQTRVLTIQFD